MLNRMMKILLLLVIFKIAWANDSTGTVAAGGITFTKTQAIKMQSETLTISPSQIKVAYLFKNLTDKKVTTTIIFPLPPFAVQGPIDEGQWDDELQTAYKFNAKDKQQQPFTNFSVLVNNQPVKFQLKSKAIFQGKDITAQLKQAGIPLNPDLASDDDNNDFDPDPGSPPDYIFPYVQYQQWIHKAKKLGLLNNEGHPLWQKQSYYYWTQIFPAYSTTQILHAYRPAVGHCIQVIENNVTLIKPDTIAIQDCDDNDDNFLNVTVFLHWISQLKPKESSPGYSTYDDVNYTNVKYILTTGANWAGPIENFTLNLKYPVTGEVLYNDFYANQAAKIKRQPGLTQISLIKFTPKKDLDILFGDALS